MEEKLAQYRAAKQKQYYKTQTLSERLFRFCSWIQLPYFKKEDKTTTVATNDYPNQYVLQPKPKSIIQKLLDHIPRYIQLSVLLSVWLGLWYYFIQLQFGAVYFAISVLFIMYFSMRTERDPNHLSAYSVFNKNCERIDGTFTAEQLEKELRFGPGSVH
ncbi:SAYSvFN domain-containing protein 1-like [Mytilus trossulus]|uniref:SAYSvFN domain-containing protein 1-like n=1 Tax=Mytilus trossulus TaxID=6551 RepID=UPI003005DC0C